MKRGFAKAGHKAASTARAHAVATIAADCHRQSVTPPNTRGVDTVGVLRALMAGFGLSLSEALTLVDRCKALYALSRYPLFNIQRTTPRHRSKNTEVITTLTVTLTSEAS